MVPDVLEGALYLQPQIAGRTQLLVQIRVTDKLVGLDFVRDFVRDDQLRPVFFSLIPHAENDDHAYAVDDQYEHFQMW